MIFISKIGIAIVRSGAVLLCRPYAFPDLILPGGVLEEGESHTENLQREIQEELGDNAILDVSSLQYLGKFSDRAAGKADRTVNIDLYLGNVTGDLVASSEIAELVWYRRDNKSYKLSAVVENKVIPFLVSRHLIA